MSSALPVECQTGVDEFGQISKSQLFYSQRIYEKDLEYEASELESLIRIELKKIIRPVNDSQKAYYKAIHTQSKDIALLKHRQWLNNNWQKYSGFFAQPQQVIPGRILPKLELIETQRQRDLFRIARLTWNLPFSGGYGRRLNYLIWDKSNEKLIGILGLQSPPLSLPARDRKYNIPRENKDYIVNLTMDAFTLGSLPPYSDLLAGKLIVLAAASKEIRQDYKKRYANRQTNMLGRVLPGKLVAVTTLSAFGKSSLYNRVSKGIYFEGCTKKVGDREIIIRKGDNIWAAESLGPCEGWGTIYFSDELYEKMKALHKKILPDKKLSGFGVGPKIRQQVIKRILRDLRLPQTLAKHNLKREVFIIPHVENLDAILSGRSKRPVFNDRPFAELADYWKERYCLARSQNQCSIEGRDMIENALGIEC